jgi:drug/metabolite transporter (DMT)-like permease
MRYIIAILSGSLMWGLAWWPLRALHDAGMTGPTLTLVSYGSAALTMIPIAVSRWRAWRGSWRGLVGIAVAGGAWNLAYVLSMVGGEAGRVVMLTYLSSAWAVLGGRLVLGEEVDARRGLCVAVALGGGACVLGGPTLFDAPIAPIDLLAIGCGVAHAATNIMFRYVEEVDLPVKNAAMFSGAAAAAALMLAVSSAELVQVPAVTWASTLVFGVTWVLLAESLTQVGVSHLPVGRSSILLISELPFTVVSASLLAGERVTDFELFGGSMIALASLIEVARPEAADAEGASGPVVGPAPEVGLQG